MNTNEAPALPTFCHPSGRLNSDYNGNCLDCGYAACHRNALVGACYRDAEDIAKTTKRRDRSGKPYVVRNLTNWIADANARLARSIAHVETLRCTCETHGPNGHYRLVSAGVGDYKLAADMYA